MDYRYMYNIGCVILFFGLVWVFLPHATHSKVERVFLGISESDAEERSHLVHTFEGFGIVMGALGLMKYAEVRIEKAKRLEHNAAEKI